MLLGITYEESLLLIGIHRPDVLATGVWINHITRAAKSAGTPLRRRRKCNLETDTGILSCSAPTWKHDHLVIVKEGMVIDTDGTIWEADVYLSAHDATPGMFLERKDQE